MTPINQAPREKAGPLDLAKPNPRYGVNDVVRGCVYVFFGLLALRTTLLEIGNRDAYWVKQRVANADTDSGSHDTKVGRDWDIWESVGRDPSVDPWAPYLLRR
jgi:hypothetical protein